MCIPLCTTQHGTVLLIFGPPLPPDNRYYVPRMLSTEGRSTCRQRSPPLLLSSFGTDGRTDRRTLGSFIDPAPHTMSAVSIIPMSMVICLFHSSIHAKKEKYNLKRIKQLCGLNGQHRAMPLTCSENVSQHPEYKILRI